MKLIIICENFTPEYINLIKSLIPYKYKVILYKDGLNDLYKEIDNKCEKFNNLCGIILGNKIHEENENLRFIHYSNLKNPFHLSIDSLTEYLEGLN